MRCNKFSTVRVAAALALSLCVHAASYSLSVKITADSSPSLTKTGPRGGR